jgi:hypothetical protein
MSVRWSFDRRAAVRLRLARTHAPHPHRRVAAGSRPRSAGGGLGGSRDRDRPRPAVQRSADGLYVGGLEEASWVEISDSRLDGRITIATSATNDGLGPTLDSDVISNAYRIVTTEGAWVGQPSAWFWLEDDTISHRVHVLSGQGAYKGLTALMELSGDLSWNGPIDVAGIIYEGELPEPPPFALAD